MTARPLSPARIGLALIILGAPWAFWPPAAHPYIEPKTFLIAGGVALLWLAAFLGEPGERLRPRRTPLDMPIAVLTTAWLAATACAVEPFDAVFGNAETQAGLLTFACVILAFYSGAALPEQDRPWVPRLAVMAGTAMGAHSILQAAGWDPLPAPAAGLPEGRVFSTAGTPVLLGALLCMAVPLALEVARSAATASRRYAAWAAFALSLAGLGLSRARGSLVAAGAGLAVLALLRSGRRGGRAAAVLLVAGTLAAALAASLRPIAASDAGRRAAWRSALLVAREWSWLGAGPEGVRTGEHMLRDAAIVRVLGDKFSPRDAHNDLLHAAATTGLAGLGAYVWTIVALAAALAPTAAGAAQLGALTALFVHAKFNPAPPAAWATAALIAGASLPAPRGSAGDGSRGVPSAARAGAAAAFAFALVCAALSWRALHADTLHGSARRAQAENRLQATVPLYEAAAAAAPWDASISEDYFSFIVEALPRAPDDRQRVSMVARGERLARGMIKRHPNDASGQQMLALALLLEARLGRRAALDEAWTAVVEGRRLDPFHVPLLELGAKIARERGDADGASAWVAEAARVRGLLPPEDPLSSGT